MRIFVVDNGSQWTHREWRVLRDLGVDTKIIANDTPLDEIKDADGLVLSGGAARIGWESAKLGNISEYIDKGDFPILGICVGHQFMALHYGGSAGPSDIPEFGRMEVDIHKPSPLFRNLPQKFVAWESHNDEIKTLPKEFEILASSVNCRIQAMHHRTKPLFGLQFHPEVEDCEFGDDIFRNFIEICRQHSEKKHKNE